MSLSVSVYLSIKIDNNYIVAVPDAEVVAVLCLVPVLHPDVPFLGTFGADTRGGGAVTGGGGAVTGGGRAAVTGGGSGVVTGGGRGACDAALSLDSTDTGRRVIAPVLSQSILK